MTGENRPQVLTDAQWEVLAPLIEACRPPHKTEHNDLRRTIEAIIWRHDSGAKWRQIPAELVTASGSGLDPDLSPMGAKVQVARVARVRNLNPAKVLALVDEHTEKPMLGLFGPAKVNVLQLNVALDGMDK